MTDQYGNPSVFRGIMPIRALSRYSRSAAMSRGPGVFCSSHVFIAGGVEGSAISRLAAMRVS